MHLFIDDILMSFSQDYLSASSDLQEVLQLDPKVREAEQELEVVTSLLRQSLMDSTAHTPRVKKLFICTHKTGFKFEKKNVWTRGFKKLNICFLKARFWQSNHVLDQCFQIRQTSKIVLFSYFCSAEMLFTKTIFLIF